MKVSIYRVPWNGTIGIMFWEERQGKIYAAKPCELVMEEVPDGAFENRPTLTLSHFYSDAFLKALAEELDRINIKTDNDAKLQGTLEAIRAHLADLRKLLKL